VVDSQLVDNGRDRKPDATPTLKLRIDGREIKLPRQVVLAIVQAHGNKRVAGVVPFDVG
jgi:hypothetical protein